MPEKCVNGFVTRATADKNAGPKTARCTAIATVIVGIVIVGIATVETASNLAQLRFATNGKGRAMAKLLEGP
jgi:hypothetical protein